MRHKFCLSKQNILNKNEIQQAFDKVQAKLHSSNFTFLISQRSSNEPGLCVILAKKNIKKATKRNLCRRLIKEYFRQHKGLLNNKSLIVLGKKQAAEATKEDLWQSIEKFHQFLEK
ncbi:ribonuclease P protein component [Allofrancisella guangzhouensis]|uniref:Ribonuclease P protein component n=1 Tax=Allofrancisella guangzhouensis TaxID=594679 RepID=A0A0A8E345_9GAMM|nr:ribonuclease P protein component [Allofrancisella guangzhouensis]AJC48438.1 ribonuclease P [Allofrancisella guangzhouensis]MBK2027661.1 ribonuclease P protein component [Allofrancisella guangzhouensis]MBK2044690.1 ribonuclease P protein component [Allofrancisella guangzhouensis]MBK2046474.1 ribonuclease P protein component [Allofrancisella guangzhouensis]